MPLRVCWEVLSMYGTFCEYHGAFLLEEQCISFGIKLSDEKQSEAEALFGN